MTTSGVYSITNTITGVTYIGSSDNIEERWRLHRGCLYIGNHSSIDLQADFNQYGHDAFHFAIIEECESDRLLIQETYYLQQLGWPCRDKIYNRRLPQGEHCQEAKELMSERRRGGTLTDEHKAKVGKATRERQLGVKRGPYKKRQKPENNNDQKK